MFDRLWNSLLAKWNQPNFRSKSAWNQKNGASNKVDVYKVLISFLTARLNLGLKLGCFLVAVLENIMNFIFCDMFNLYL